VLTGAESTGKTTLAETLARHYHTVWVPEYVRIFVEEQGALPVYKDVERIARGTLGHEAALRPQARRLLLLDTDLVTVCLYSHYYFGRCPAWVEQASRAHHADLYLLAEDDIPWVPDPGQRDGPEIRAALQPLFRAELKRRGVPTVRITGSLAERIETAIAAIDRLLTAPPQRPGVPASIQVDDGAP
jgi:nicotinamide riboside kinase